MGSLVRRRSLWPWRRWNRNGWRRKRAVSQGAYPGHMRNAAIPLLGLLLVMVDAVTFILAWDWPPKTRLRRFAEAVGAASVVIGLTAFAIALIRG